MSELNARTRVVGSTVGVTLAVWAAFCSGEYAMTQLSVANIGLVALIAFGVGALGTTKRMLARRPFAMLLMLALCCVPWLIATAFGPMENIEFNWSSMALEDSLRLRWIGVLAGRAEGASLTAALLCAEALTLARLSRAAGPRHSLAFAVLLALPMQLAWLHVFANVQSPFDRPLIGWVVVPLVSAALLPLSVFYGARRTVDVVATLTLASWAAMAVMAGQLAEALGGYNPCTPATRAQVTEWWLLDEYPSRWLELAPWAAFLSLGIALIALKQLRAVALVAAVAFIVLFIDATELSSRRRQLPLLISTRVDGCATFVVPGFATSTNAEEVLNRNRESCVLVYGRAQLEADTTSFNPFDHVRALSAIEPILRRR